MLSVDSQQFHAAARVPSETGPNGGKQDRIMLTKITSVPNCGSRWWGLYAFNLPPREKGVTGTGAAVFARERSLKHASADPRRASTGLACRCRQPGRRVGRPRQTGAKHATGAAPPAVFSPRTKRIAAPQKSRHVLDCNTSTERRRRKDLRRGQPAGRKKRARSLFVNSGPESRAKPWARPRATRI